MKVIIASKNPVKIEAARAAFSEVFSLSKDELEMVCVDADSGVPDQPMNYEQTRLGALTRVENCLAQSEQDNQGTENNLSVQSADFRGADFLCVDYYVAYEGGVDVFEDGPKTFAILCISNGQEMIFGQTATLPLPLSIYEGLLEGHELGDAMDALFNTHNIKQKGGAIGQLTAGLETRQSIYKSATILALSYFALPQLYA